MSIRNTYQIVHTMAPASTVKKHLKIEKMTTRQLKNRLENLLEELNKENAEHMIAVLHPNIQDCEAEEVSSKLDKAVEPEKTSCSKRLGRCPHCRKRTDVSKIPETRRSLRCQQKKCGKSTAMKKWLCVNCSRTRDTDIEFDNCWCFARSLVKKGNTVLTCPQKECHGWKQFDNIDLLDCRKKPKTVRTKCDYCKESSFTQNWFCNSCGKGKTEVKFAECTCFATLTDFLETSKDIVLACPRRDCRKTKQFKKKELTQVIMKKIAETRMTCKSCSSRFCLWKWKCFKCKKLTCKCNCKKPDTSHRGCLVIRGCQEHILQYSSK